MVGGFRWRHEIFMMSRFGMFRIIPVALFVTLLGCAPAPKPPQVAKPHEDLDGIAWVQTSAEYAGITRQTYRAAIDRMEEARLDPKWSAIPEQAKVLSTMPADAEQKNAAVILDVDETVLDNSGYQAALIERGENYSPESWDAWVKAQCAVAIPGAKTFLDVCRASGVTVFFVTNREAKVESSTRANLEACQLIMTDDPDLILSKRERDRWGSDKQPRREFVAKHYRVLLVIGDDFNDFIWAGKNPTAEDRRALADEYEDYWGTRWFALPNPSYGGWERALYDFKDELPNAEKLFHKRDHLRTMEEMQKELEAAKAAAGESPDTSDNKAA